MFLQLNHQRLFAFQEARTLVNHAYKMTTLLHTEEKYNLNSQIRRAALSVYLNLAEGSSRKSAIERKRFFEIARGSVIEIDAALDIVADCGYCDKNVLQSLGTSIVSVFVSTTKLIQAIENHDKQQTQP